MGKPTGHGAVVTGLVRTAFLVNAVYTASAREFGVTAQQGQLLCVLMTQPYGMSELGTTLGLAKSSLSGLVDRTERIGLVRRESDPADTRAVRVSLTDEGSELAEAFYTETCRRIALLPKGFSAGSLDTLSELLGRIVERNEVPMVFMEPNEGPGA